MKQYTTKIEEMLDGYKKNGELKDIDNKLIQAILCSPVETIAEDFFINNKKLLDKEVDSMFDLVWEVISN